MTKSSTMKKYLICYWAERNDVSTDLEDLIDADNIKEALDKFIEARGLINITSISVIPNFIPRFDYENNI